MNFLAWPTTRATRHEATGGAMRHDRRMIPLESRLKQRARELGFELVGIAPASATDGFKRLRAWLDRGCAGEMNYMHQHAQARHDPSSILPEVRSVVMVGMNYYVGESESAGLKAQ